MTEYLEQDTFMGVMKLPIPEGYRLLGADDTIQHGDKYYPGGRWNLGFQGTHLPWNMFEPMTFGTTVGEEPIAIRPVE